MHLTIPLSPEVISSGWHSVARWQTIFWERLFFHGSMGSLCLLSHSLFDNEAEEPQLRSASTRKYGLFST